MVLVGGHDCIEKVSESTYAFCKITIANDQHCAMLATFIPDVLGYEFEDGDVIPIDNVAVGDKAHLCAQQKAAIPINRLPEVETTITSQEYFLTRWLGQVVRSCAVYVRLLPLNPQTRQPNLHNYFSQSLALIDGSL